MKHYYTYTQIEHKSIRELLTDLPKLEGIKLKDLRLSDLLDCNRSMIGLYILLNEKGQPVYVGKTSSRTILERVAGHFDVREEGFMNNFLCGLAGKPKSRKTVPATTAELEAIIPLALEHKLIFIEVNNKKIINKLEGILIRNIHTKAKLMNIIRGKKENDNLDQIIRDII